MAGNQFNLVTASLALGAEIVGTIQFEEGRYPNYYDYNIWLYAYSGGRWRVIAGDSMEPGEYHYRFRGLAAHTYRVCLDFRTYLPEFQYEACYQQIGNGVGMQLM
ncbi:MAG: hypothetical protein R2932_41340 [Caldilineaceae bacterium]